MKITSSNNKLFNLNRTTILASIISASFSLHALASAGRVEFALGGATISRVDGTSSQAIKGDEINAGDTIKTTDGRVQVRFTDGGYMSFQPNTEFKVEDYAYSGKTDGTEKAFFRLIQGGLRAITGVVGHANKPNYKVSTTVATIGIRGSEYQAEFNGKLTAHCSHGSIYVFNDQGNLILFRGQTAVVGTGAPTYGDNIEGVGARGPSNTNSAYNQQNQSQDLNNVFRNGEQRNPDGSLTSLISSITFDNGGFANVVFDSASSGEASVNSDLSGTFNGEGTYTQNFGVVLDGAGNFISSFAKYTSGSDSVNNEIKPQPNATTKDFATNGDLVWFRIAGDVKSTTTYLSGGNVYNTNESIYSNPSYIIGSPTSYSDIMSLNGYEVSYNLIGGTTPVNSAGVTGTLNSASATINIGQYYIVGNLNVTHSANTYNEIFSGSINITQNGATFNVNGAGTSGSSSVAVAGFIAGPNAAQLGLSYAINPNYNASNAITGVAALNKVETVNVGSGGCSNACNNY